MRLRVAIFGCLTLILALACGEDGDSDSTTEDPGGGGVTPGIVDPGPTKVSGSFFLGAATNPALGHEIWVVDHTAPSYARHPLDDTGSFSIPVESFAESHVYSFHLVKDFRLLGDVDFSSSQSGTQAAFTYRLGYGFDLGDVVVNVTKAGDVDWAAPNLVAELGGGFSLSSQSVSLDQYPIPSILQRFDVGGKLVVLDPQSLLHAFYLRATNPALYAQELAAHSGVHVVASGFGRAELSRIFVVDAGEWLSSSRLAMSEDVNYTGAPLWGKSGFEVPAVTNDSYLGSVFAGQRLEPRPLMIMKVQPTEGAQITIPRVASRLFGMVPRIVGIATNGGAVAAVDYTSATATNGLTRPFCQTGAVTLEVAPPEDVTGTVIPWSTLSRVEVALEYYGLADGRTTLLKATAADFSGSYASPVTDTPTAGLSRSWTPDTQTLRYDLDTSLHGNSTQQLPMPAEVIPAGAGGGGVFRVRLKVYVRSGADAAESGVAVWLTRSGC